MRLRSAAVMLAAVGLLMGLPSSAGAERQWLVVGMLDQVDPAKRTIVVNGRTLTVTRDTVIKDGTGIPGGWEELVYWDGDYASALVRQGRPHPEIRTIVLEEEPEDE